MIVKRNRPPKKTWPRAIVRRGTPVIGERRGMIIKRGRGGGVQSPPPRGPRLRRPQLGWRPSKGMLAAAGVLCALGLMAGGAYWVWTSPFFKISNVEVTGNERIPASTIVERTDVLGDSMFSADLAAAQKQLYALPLVASVKVERQWPHTLKVMVEERKAWGTWEQSGVRYTIDRDGVVLGTNPPPAGSPAIKSSEPGSRQQGDRVDYQAVDAAAEIYEKLPRQLGTTVQEVAFVAGKGVQVTTANNQTALLGDSSSIAYKLAVWAALSHEAQAQRINYTTIDLRYGNRPVLQ
jgi:cell division protein FtsQ